MNKSTQGSAQQMSQIMLEGVREIIGQAGVNAVLNTVAGTSADTSGLDRTSRPDPVLSRRDPLTATPMYNDMSNIQSALEKLYGPRGGRGITLRSGRAAFKYFLRHHGDRMGLSRLDYRLLPTHSRMKVGLQAMAAVFTEMYAGYVEVSEDPLTWYWQIRHCPWCLERQGAEGGGLCFFIVGMLQEFLSWSSGGKNYHVEESECSAAGGQACVIRIEKQPLD